MSKPKFAYLLLKEHPYGREMLMQILSEGFVPELIIEEDSAIADEEREKFLKRIEGNPIAPPIQEQAAEHEFSASNSPATTAAMTKMAKTRTAADRSSRIAGCRQAE